NGYESWIEYKRTGFPALLPVAASLNGGIYPTRLPYPADESSLNSANYNAASSTTNGNSFNAKVWWDKF
ncbi:MAG: SusD/RagB family nutrient-binding outer membrane lipoprotein, partial [Bacteroidetes bacterium]|nr:SusD/RagB family nutrient-binding outer membrane lipoprotein [Bacteroidota bacterium]